MSLDKDWLNINLNRLLLLVSELSDASKKDGQTQRVFFKI